MKRCFVLGILAALLGTPAHATDMDLDLVRLYGADQETARQLVAMGFDVTAARPGEWVDLVLLHAG